MHTRIHTHTQPAISRSLCACVCFLQNICTAIETPPTSLPVQAPLSSPQPTTPSCLCSPHTFAFVRCVTVAAKQQILSSNQQKETFSHTRHTHKHSTHTRSRTHIEIVRRNARVQNVLVMYRSCCCCCCSFFVLFRAAQLCASRQSVAFYIVHSFHSPLSHSLCLCLSHCHRSSLSSCVSRT